MEVLSVLLQKYIKRLCTEHLASTAVGRGPGGILPISQLSFLTCCIICHLREGNWSTERQNDGTVRMAFLPRMIIVIIG